MHRPRRPARFAPSSRPHRPVFFIHVPKTGGTSLAEVVRSVYPPERCLFTYEREDHLDELRAEAQRAAVVFGHFSFGLHDVLGFDARYVTLLREPVSRVTSFFRHQARHEDSEFGRDIANGMTLRDLLRSESCEQVNNHMVRIISSEYDERQVNDRAALELAWRNLVAHFDYVGTTERMVESVDGIGRVLGWQRSPQPPRLNDDPEAEDCRIDYATRAEIMKYNALDVELYERVSRGRGRRRLFRSSRLR